MKITNEILAQYKLQLDEGMDSIDFIEAMRKGLFTIDLLHYIRAYYRLTEEEFDVYCSECNINNSTNFWYSDTIEDSENIYGSRSVKNCKFIRNSNDIISSTDIYNSKNINFSNDVAHSSQVECSNCIIESNIINDSYNIARSDNIKWSNAILNSSHLNNCSYTYMSNSLTDCHFCGFMENSRRCLFCVGLTNKEYYVFNQPVSPIEYTKIKEKLMSLLESETSKMIRINDSKHTAEERFRLKRRFDSVFDGLSQSFYGWVGTVPNYSDEAFLDLFFRDREENLKILE